VTWLLQALKASDTDSGVRERFLDQRFSLETTAAFQRVLEERGLDPERASWMERGEHENAKEFRSNLTKRLDELHGTTTTFPGKEPADPSPQPPEPPEERREEVGPDGKKKKAPGNAEVLHALLDTYLDKFDILRQTGGKRRLPDTTGTRGHYIPAEVKRRVYRRTMGRCVILKCTNTFKMEVVHEVADCLGGNREIGNLGLRCWMHHHLKDSGIIQNEGTVEEPSYRNRFGEVLRCRKPCPEPRPPPENGGLFPPGDGSPPERGKDGPEPSRTSRG
jgi:hypothetical protein